MTNELGQQLAAISTWVDEHPPNAARDAEARLWGRCAKVNAEAGEVMDAMAAMTGQNPRKPAQGCVADVLDELLDVAATALAAVEHIDGNRGGSVDLLAEHVAGLVERSAIGITNRDECPKDDGTGQCRHTAARQPCPGDTLSKPWQQ